MGLVENKEEVITASQRSVMYLLRQRVHHYSKATTFALVALIVEMFVFATVVTYLFLGSLNMMLIMSSVLLVGLIAVTVIRLRIVSKHKRVCESNLDSYQTR